MDQSPPNEGSSVPVQAHLVPEPFPTPPRRKSRFFVRLLLVFLVLGFFGSLMLNLLLVGVAAMSGIDSENRVQEKFVSHNRNARDKVAIFSIEGTILSGEGFFKQQIDHARKDAEDGRLKAIVLRVNSPGGTISGSDYMLHHLKKLHEDTKVPIVVSMGGIAASGGYYVSMCVGDTPQTIYAEPTTWTGSIGVIIPHYNFAELMEKWGIQEDEVASHRLKGMGSFARKMTDEERKIFQSLVDEGFTRFKDIIHEGRPKYKQDPDALNKLATGQVFTADQAKQDGLVDEIGFVEDAVDRAIQLAKLDKDDVQVVKYKAEPQLSDLLFGSQAQRPQSLDLAAVLEVTTPRAYYLCTWLPALAANANRP